MQADISSLAGRDIKAMTGSPVQERVYTGPTYYEHSPVKASKYGTLVWTYTYVAGLAGSAQVLATVASLLRRPHSNSIVRHGRYLAMAGPTIGSALLIADLHTPSRWYNMLRIFRKTSPMSIGSYILTSFGLSSGIAAAAEWFGHVRWLRWLRPAAKVAQVPAALAGAGMSVYTGALLSSTSTPVWSAAPRLMTARFACSAMATAAAALSLAERFRGDPRNCAMLDRIAMTATLADTAISLAADRTYAARGVADSLKGENAVAAEHKTSKLMEHAAPLLCYGLNGMLPRQSRALSIAGALGVLAGGLLMRSTIFHAGNRSARRAQDYLAITQPGQAGPGHRLARR